MNKIHLKYKCKCGSQSYEITEVLGVYNTLYIENGVLNPIGVTSQTEPTGRFLITCHKCEKIIKVRKVMFLDNFIDKYKFSK